MLEIQESADAERSRFASWWWSDDGRRFGLAAELPAASGAVVARALRRLTERLPAVPAIPRPPGGLRVRAGSRR